MVKIGNQSLQISLKNRVFQSLFKIYYEEFPENLTFYSALGDIANLVALIVLVVSNSF